MPRIVISTWDSFRKTLPFSMWKSWSRFFGPLGFPSLQVRCLQLLVELKSSFHNLRNQVRSTTTLTQTRPMMTHIWKLQKRAPGESHYLATSFFHASTQRKQRTLGKKLRHGIHVMNLKVAMLIFPKDRNISFLIGMSKTVYLENPKNWPLPMQIIVCHLVSCCLFCWGTEYHGPMQ